MRKEIILIPIIALLFIAGCTAEKPIGGDKDEHGCLIAAGYSWCESKQKCLRTWEEGCHLSKNLFAKLMMTAFHCHLTAILCSA